MSLSSSWLSSLSGERGSPEESHCKRSMARAAPHAPHAAPIVHAAHAAAGGGGGNGGDGGG